MYEIVESAKYKSQLKKIKKSGQWRLVEKPLQEVVNCLAEKGRVEFDDVNLNKRYADHELYENRTHEKGTREVHVRPNVLLFYIVKGNTVTLLNIDSHSGSRITSSFEDTLEDRVKARLLAASKKNAV